MKKYDVHVEYANAPATEVEDAEHVRNFDNELVIVKGNKTYYCNIRMITCYTVTKKEDSDYMVCSGCADLFNREGAKKVGMICPKCHLELVPLRTVEGGD